MTAIENLHNLDCEIKNLERKYNQAINYIAALRQTQAAILTGIYNNQIDKIKDVFIYSDFNKQRDELCDISKIEEDIKHYSEIKL